MLRKHLAKAHLNSRSDSNFNSKILFNTCESINRKFFHFGHVARCVHQKLDINNNVNSLENLLFVMPITGALSPILNSDTA